MRVNRKLIIISTIITVLSFISAFWLNFYCVSSSKDFWVNVLIGILGGAALTIVTSTVSYNHERQICLEKFSYDTRQLLSFLNKYQENMTVDQKIQFYLEYADLDKTSWDMDYGSFDFVFEKICGSRKYIYYSIYKPILDFNVAVSNHVWQFRWYLDGSGKNERVINDFLNELQNYLIEKETQELPTQIDERGKVISTCKYSYTKPKLTANINQELSGRYYDLMYGRKVRKMEENNGHPKNAQP
ncbi:hypothetical protein RX411_01365 [Faecalibacterium prausnitzii]|uniref:hypothetical protein n=1 Tax=Faecalibacterium prausnitzii TaxID=853 RepID=UPI002908A8AA|nr:hypothetical protein [Faecalibacterium prausnitzii]